MRRAATLALTGFVMASGSPDDGSAMKEPTTIETLEIVLNEEGCYGRCAAYSVVLRGTGEVQYFGDQWVLEEDAHETLIPQEHVLAIFDLFRQADFFALDDFGVPNFDIAVTSLSLAYDGHRKAISIHWSSGEVADAVEAAQVAELIRAIDSIPQIREWVGTIELVEEKRRRRREIGKLLVAAAEGVRSEDPERRAEAVASILPYLEWSEPLVRVGAIGIIEQSVEEADSNQRPYDFAEDVVTAQLLAGLRDQSDEVRSASLSALGKLRATVAIPEILAVFDELSANLQHVAVRALVAIGTTSSRTRDLIAGILIEIDRELAEQGSQAGMSVRLHLLIRLGELGSQGSSFTLSRLVEALDDPSVAIQRFALWGLCRMGSGARQALPMIERLEERVSDPAVRRVARRVVDCLSESK